VALSRGRTQGDLPQSPKGQLSQMMAVSRPHRDPEGEASARCHTHLVCIAVGLVVAQRQGVAGQLVRRSHLRGHPPIHRMSPVTACAEHNLNAACLSHTVLPAGPRRLPSTVLYADWVIYFTCTTIAYQFDQHLIHHYIPKITI
jgi:hypothetical protein